MNKNPGNGESITPQSGIENSIVRDELSLSNTVETSLEKHLDDREIDLNALFPDIETDLNILFPDAEVKYLLKSIIKNKKDLGSIEERLTTENEISKGEQSS